MLVPKLASAAGSPVLNCQGETHIACLWDCVMRQLSHADGELVSKKGGSLKSSPDPIKEQADVLLLLKGP